jgi:hypothetical protein
MDIVVPDIQTYSDFNKGEDIYAYALVLPGHEEYDQINEGCDVNVFLKTNTGNDFIRGTVMKREGPVPTVPKEGHQAFRLLIRKK